jgi:hypothetical protein
MPHRHGWFTVARVRNRAVAWGAALLALMWTHPSAAPAATVSWNVDSDGFWDVAANWSTGMVPQPGDDVVIDRPAANVTVTFRSGTVAVNSLTSSEAFAITSGTLNLAAASTVATLTMSGGQTIPAPCSTTSPAPRSRSRPPAISSAAFSTTPAP